MMYLYNIILRPHIFHKCSLVLSKTMFIRSIEKSNSELKTKTKNFLQSQLYTKFFVIDFEATCDNGAHLLKPQVDNYF